MKGNTVSIKGTVTRDAEVRSTASGKFVAQWGLAWNGSRKNQGTGEYEEVPHFFDVKCWMSERQADFVAPQIVKGAPCAIIDGRLEYESWERDGQRRSRVVIMVGDPVGGMLLAPPKGADGRRAQAAYPAPAQNAPYSATASNPLPTQNAPSAPYSVYDEDIPF